MGLPALDRVVEACVTWRGGPGQHWVIDMDVLWRSWTLLSRGWRWSLKVKYTTLHHELRLCCYLLLSGKNKAFTFSQLGAKRFNTESKSGFDVFKNPNVSQFLTFLLFCLYFCMCFALPNSAVCIWIYVYICVWMKSSFNIIISLLLLLLHLQQNIHLTNDDCLSYVDLFSCLLVFCY